MDEMNKDEIKIVKNSTIYEIRLMLDVDGKETYTKEEILKLLDTIARAKETEQNKKGNDRKGGLATALTVKTV